MAENKKYFAPGIPISKKIEKIPTYKSPTVWNASIQEHKTKRGKHYDLRLNPPGSDKAYSFAIPKAKLPDIKEKLLAVETFTHTKDYMPFEGEIGSGYGKGKVKSVFNDRVEVIKSTPHKIIFNKYDESSPKEYALVRAKGNNWILQNKTVGPNDPKFKPEFKRFKFSEEVLDKIDFEQAYKDYILTLKMDGAFSEIKIRDGKAKAFSHRKPKDTRFDTGIIEYTHKIPKLQYAKLPKDLDNTDIQAEIVARKGNDIAPSHKTGGLLNSKVWKSRESQKYVGELEPWAFNITKFKGQDVKNKPFSEKIDMLREVMNHIPNMNIIPFATTKQEKMKFLDKIKSGKSKYTKEGVVLVGQKNNEMDLVRAKIRPDYDVYIRGFYPGSGRLKDKGVGGYFYSFTPKGKIKGRVGTGISDLERRIMHKNPDKYIGKVAKVTAQGTFPDEKGNIKTLRAPAHKEIHWEKSL